jgi:hypothetical protein
MDKPLVKNYNIVMKCNRYPFVIISLLLVSLLTACSTANTPTNPEELTDDQGSPFNSDVPIVVPTFAVPQPAGINPGKFIGTVYISDKDNKFHRADCPNLALTSTPLPRQQAVVQGYSACQVCDP